MTPLSANRLRAAASVLVQWKRPLVFSHEKPDGDALGALTAMRAILRRLGLDAQAVLFDAIPDCYTWFRRCDPIPTLGKDIAVSDLSSCDAVILLDTCAYGQLRPVADWLRSASLPRLIVDHHATRDPLGGEELIDESAAATCLILYDWARTMGWPIDAQTGSSLFIGMATDTGWFRHSNTDHRVLAACGDLIAGGVCANELYQCLYERESPARIRLLGQAIRTLELSCDDRLAVMALDAAAFRGAGATPVDTEDIVNEPLRIGSVIASLLFVDNGDGVIRVNFRSRSPRAGAEEALDLDVSAAASAFGGGGHRRAAGARIEGQLTQVRRRVVEHLHAEIRRLLGLKAGSTGP